MANNKSFRLRFTFWLDMAKPDEQALADTIDTLKQERSFTRTIRQGIRLITELRAGRVDYLLELFPDIAARLQAKSTGHGGNGDDIASKLDRLEQLMLSSTTGDPGKLVAAQTAAAPRKLDVSGFNMAFDDDDDLDTVVIRKDTRKVNAAQNFLNSVMNLTQ